MGMKRFNVFLTRDYSVEIRAENESEARECVEFFVTGGLDGSSDEERNHYNFVIERIKPITNHAFQVEEIGNG